MTAANIRFNIGAPFPSQVKATAPVTITKKNGVWIVGFAIGNLATQIPAIAQYPTDYLVIWDDVQKTHFRIPLSAFPVLGRPQRAVAGQIVFTPSDQILNCTFAQAYTHTLPGYATRLGVPITINDAGRSFNLFPQRIAAAAGEAIDGQPFIDLNARGERTTFVPYNDGTNQGWFVE